MIQYQKALEDKGIFNKHIFLAKRTRVIKSEFIDVIFQRLFSVKEDVYGLVFLDSSLLLLKSHGYLNEVDLAEIPYDSMSYVEIFERVLKFVVNQNQFEFEIENENIEQFKIEVEKIERGYL